MSEELDDHGQPIIRNFSRARLEDSEMDELIGICRGVLADGVLVLEEAKFLKTWLYKNKELRTTYAGDILYKTLKECLTDGVMDAPEEDRLVDTLMRFIGGTPTTVADKSYSTLLPLDAPVPEIVISSRSFCFTGKFGYGTRAACEAAVMDRGGEVHKSTTLKTNYLVIGDIGSSQWIHSNSGRKIERAIEIREERHSICIVCEGDWTAAVRG